MEPFNPISSFLSFFLSLCRVVDPVLVVVVVVVEFYKQNFVVVVVCFVLFCEVNSLLNWLLLGCKSKLAGYTAGRYRALGGSAELTKSLEKRSK